MKQKQPGRLVRLEDGRIGRTKNEDKPVDGKIKVYILNTDRHTKETTLVNLLVEAHKLKVIGFVD